MSLCSWKKKYREWVDGGGGIEDEVGSWVGRENGMGVHM